MPQQSLNGHPEMTCFYPKPEGAGFELRRCNGMPAVLSPQARAVFEANRAGVVVTIDGKPATIISVGSDEIVVKCGDHRLNLPFKTIKMALALETDSGGAL